MIEGLFRGGLPWIELPVHGESLEFVVDTGFQGDMALPRALAQRLFGRPVSMTVHMLADGSLHEIAVHEVTLDWGIHRVIEVLALGEQPLVGTTLFAGHHLHAELTEGGQVLIEPM